jgi:hypothetical protein
MAAHSPSAADRKAANDRKTEYNSFVAKELKLVKKNDFRRISAPGGDLRSSVAIGFETSCVLFFSARPTDQLSLPVAE